VPTTALAVLAPAPTALLVKVTVTVTTEPAGALAGSCTVVVTSASSTPLTWVLVLFALLLSATLGAVTLAVTVPPVAVRTTLMGALVAVWPGASVTGAKVLVTPLTTICGVKVTVALPLFDRVTVVVTVLPGVPLGIGLTTTPGSLNSTVSAAVAVLFALLLSGVAVATVLVAFRLVLPRLFGTVVVKLWTTLAPGASWPRV